MRPVAVFKTYEDEQKARERAKKVNDGQREDKELLVVFEVRERGSEGTLKKYDVCAAPSRYFEDEWTGTDTFRYETGCETREAAERRAREINDERGACPKRRTPSTRSGSGRSERRLIARRYCPASPRSGS